MNQALVDMMSELRRLRDTEIVVTGATIEGVPVRLGAREMRVRRVGGPVRLLMLPRLLVRPSISLALKFCSVLWFLRWGNAGFVVSIVLISCF